MPSYSGESARMLWFPWRPGDYSPPLALKTVSSPGKHCEAMACDKNREENTVGKMRPVPHPVARPELQAKLKKKSQTRKTVRNGIKQKV